jgi:PAS domain S-box-containing protein
MNETAHVDDEVFWKKDGTAIPVEYHSHPIYREGMVIGTVITFRDQSEKIKAEQTILENEQKYRSTFEQAFVGIAHVSLEGRFIEINQRLCDITGYSKEALMSMRFMDITHKDDLDDDLNHVEALIAGKNDRYTIEKRYIHKDGHEVWIELMVTLLKNSDGSPKNFISVINDITTKKRAETALRKTQEAHSQAEKISHFGSWDWNITTGDLFWTDEIYRIFGVKPQLFPATYEAFLNTIHPDDRQAVIDAVNSAVADAGCEYAIEHRVIRSNGETRTVYEKGSVYRDNNGEATRMIGTVHDITEQKNAEQELEKYKIHLEKLLEERTKALHEAQDELVRKERLATLGQLTATVSHELRNPLSAIRPSLFLLQKLSNSRDEKIQRALERINRNISRCDEIIDELLDFTRIKTLEIHPVQLDSWLETIIDEQDIPGDITVNKTLNLNQDHIPFDSGRLRRAIINVVENALQAMKEAPLDTGQHSLNIITRHNNNRAEIIIRDSGTGIPEDILKRVFEPLFSTKGFGVGLGMSTVKQIMEQHQGGIEIESTPGNGTSVTLWLPQQAGIKKAM